MTLLNQFKSLLGFKERDLHESSLGRIYQHSQNRTIGIITAFRGNLTLSANNNANRALEGAIRSNGFGFVKLEGHWTENQGSSDQRKVIERSFLVISEKEDNGKLKGFLKKAGYMYDQDAVVYKEAESQAIIIGTTSGSTSDGRSRWPGLGTEVTIGNFKPNKISDIYSKMRGQNSTFIFESAAIPEGFWVGYK